MRPIFEYSDYRQFLRDYYAWAKENKRGFSHRSFLSKAGMAVLEPGTHVVDVEGREVFGHAMPDFNDLPALAVAEGALVCKVFHGSGHSQLVELFKRTFRVVKPIKPKASRDKSSETFLVGIGVKSRVLANP